MHATVWYVQIRKEELDTNDAHDRIYKHITSMWEACLCPKGEYDRWHRLECLMGDCSRCGFHFFKVCPQELLESDSFLLK